MQAVRRDRKLLWAMLLASPLGFVALHTFLGVVLVFLLSRLKHPEPEEVMRV